MAEVDAVRPVACASTPQASVVAVAAAVPPAVPVPVRGTKAEKEKRSERSTVVIPPPQLGGAAAADAELDPASQGRGSQGTVKRRRTEGRAAPSIPRR